MKNLTKLSFVFAFLTASYTIIANPSLNNGCHYSVARPQNGSGILFDESCTTAYVMPPKIGIAEIKSLARTTNLQFCPSVKDINRIAKRTFDSIDIISEKIKAMIESFKPLDQELIDLRLELATRKVKMESAKEQLEQAENRLQSLEQTAFETKKDYKNCVRNSAEDDSSCIELKTAWEDAKNELRKFSREEYREKSDEFDFTKEEHDLLSARINMINNRYKDGIIPMLELQERLNNLNLQTMELYQNYVKLEGATGQITWSLNWDQLIEEYRKMNPRLPVSWLRLSIKEAEFLGTIKSQDMASEFSNITAIKSAIILGARPTGFAGMGNGDKVIGIQTETSTPTKASVIFGNSISGQIVLTLAGACPYFEGIDDRTSLDLNQLTNHMAASLVYTYEVAVRRAYTASYNLSSLLNRIESKTKKGGFFSTSSAHEIIDDANSLDWFSIKFDGNSADYQYSLEEQKQITREVKQELMDKAIRQFAILNAGQAVPPIVPQYLDSGATIAANELRKCWHLYCQAGSVILGVANSIWGKSQAVSTFHQNNSAWAIERIDGLQFINLSSSLAFQSK